MPYFDKVVNDSPVFTIFSGQHEKQGHTD